LIYRADAYTPVEIPRERIEKAESAEESLGIRRWTRNRDWRAAGFYGHFTTFAEVLQLIVSLTLGIFIASISKSRFFARNRETDDEDQKPKIKNRFFNPQIVLGIFLALMALALLLTVTRASQLAFLISAAVIVLLNGNRKIILTLAVLIVPIAIVGLLYLQSSRRVGFFDTKDNSITWRQTVYREGFNLWTSNARNFTLGVGMDSIKRFARDWRLFDDGRLPMGHFHSTPLQLVVERGLPALIIWLTILGIYARTLWRFLKSEIRNPKSKSKRASFSAVSAA
jgi:O-antigen ligase